MRVFITGDKGQLGSALRVAFDGQELGGCDLPEVDVSDRKAIKHAIADFSPEIVIHAAAWTDVDGCARNPDHAHLINAIGTQNVALASAAVGAALVYVSTNEVFDGHTSTSYNESDDLHPINPYGQSKAAGESFVRSTLDRHYIVRTAWLYDPQGRNFPHRILELARSGTSLRVVSDEVSNPTYAPDLAKAISKLINTDSYGIYHLTNEGFCSRFEFAKKVLHLAGLDEVSITPITLSEFKRDSTPPSFAPLANEAAAILGITLRPWEEALAEFIGLLQID